LQQQQQKKKKKKKKKKKGVEAAKIRIQKSAGEFNANNQNFTNHN
jgi:hypothetical protein